MKLFQSLVLSGLLSLMSLTAMAQSEVTPIGDILSDGTDEEIVTIQGRITLLTEDEIHIQDPTGKIIVELEDHHKATKFKKGDEVLVNGEVDINLLLSTMKIEAIDVEKVK